MWRAEKGLFGGSPKSTWSLVSKLYILFFHEHNAVTCNETSHSCMLPTPCEIDAFFFRLQEMGSCFTHGTERPNWWLWITWGMSSMSATTMQVTLAQGEPRKRFQYPITGQLCLRMSRNGWDLFSYECVYRNVWLLQLRTCLSSRLHIALRLLSMHR